MKINLLLDSPQTILSGYINVDPFANGRDERVAHAIDSLDGIAHDAEAEEVLALDVLTYFTPREADGIVFGWIRKLALKGSLTIVDYDAVSVCQKFVSGEMNLGQFAACIHGQQKNKWDSRKCVLTLPVLCDIFTRAGLMIEKKAYLDDGKFLIKGVRVA